MHIQLCLSATTLMFICCSSSIGTVYCVACISHISRLLLSIWFFKAEHDKLLLGFGFCLLPWIFITECWQRTIWSSEIGKIIVHTNFATTNDCHWNFRFYNRAAMDNLELGNWETLVSIILLWPSSEYTNFHGLSDGQQSLVIADRHE
jgi:hypothetical protein